MKLDAVKFDCEKYLSLTSKDKEKLSMIKRFKLFKWFVENGSKDQGHCFG